MLKSSSPTRLEGMETCGQGIVAGFRALSPTRLEGMETRDDDPLFADDAGLRPALRGWKL